MGYKDASSCIATRSRTLRTSSLSRWSWPKRHDAYLVGVHIQEPFKAPAMFDGTWEWTFFGVFEETAKANLAAAKAAFAKAVKGTKLSTEWRSRKVIWTRA